MNVKTIVQQLLDAMDEDDKEIFIKRFLLLNFLYVKLVYSL